MSYLLNVANERPMLRFSGHDHSRIYLCGAVRIVIFWRGGLRRALAHSLKADRPSRTAKFSTLFEFH
jgi:hypothetical protein